MKRYRDQYEWFKRKYIIEPIIIWLSMFYNEWDMYFTFIDWFKFCLPPISDDFDYDLLKVEVTKHISRRPNVFPGIPDGLNMTMFTGIFGSSFAL